MKLEWSEGEEGRDEAAQLGIQGRKPRLKFMVTSTPILPCV